MRTLSLQIRLAQIEISGFEPGNAYHYSEKNHWRTYVALVNNTTYVQAVAPLTSGYG